jgi:hypothetical protein
VAWGPECRWCLAIRLGDSSGRGVYLIERERVFEWDYEPAQVFDGFEDLAMR